MSATLLDVEPLISHRAYTLWRRIDRLKVPVHYDGRTKHSSNHPAPPLSAGEARAWLAHHHAQGDTAVGFGFRPDGTGLVCVDLDESLTPEGQWTSGARAIMARLPGALIEQSVGGRGAHIWTNAPAAAPLIARRGQVLTPHGKLEMYANGQFVAGGRVLGGDARVDHSAELLRMLEEFWPPVAEAGPVDQVQAWEELSDAERAIKIEHLRSALAVLDPDDYETWVSVGQALRSLGADGYRLWAPWSATSRRFPGGDGLEKWDTFSGERTDYRAVFAKAAATKRWTNPATRPDVTAQPAGQLFAGGAAPDGMLTEPPASRQAPSELTFVAAAGGAIPGSLEKVVEVLMSPESGVSIARDEFLDQIIVTYRDGAPRSLEDEDYTDLRIRFERRGFKPITAEIMRSAVHWVARENRFDSAVRWAESLAWDGVPRIEAALCTYYGAEDTAYGRAVGAYLFTALAGRCLAPGVKADMAIIMVGLQGARKTSSVEALAPTPESFGEVDLKKHDTDLARSMRGKLVLEMAELNGLAGRDQEATKAWISRRWEEWTPKFKETGFRYPRRCVLIGTGNAPAFLDDETGARRFLPIHVGAVNVEALVRDRDQLWAEGIVRFRASGIAWQEAERLARDEHAKFEIVDEREALVAAWLAAVPPPMLGQPPILVPRCEAPVRPIDVAIGALNFQPSQYTATVQKQISKIMRKLGYAPVKQWLNGRSENTWIRSGM